MRRGVARIAPSHRAVMRQPTLQDLFARAFEGIGSDLPLRHKLAARAVVFVRQFCVARNGECILMKLGDGFGCGQASNH